MYALVCFSFGCTFTHCTGSHADTKHTDMIDVCFLPDYDLTFLNAALSDMSKLLYKFQIMLSSSEMV